MAIRFIDSIRKIDEKVWMNQQWKWVNLPGSYENLCALEAAKSPMAPRFVEVEIGEGKQYVPYYLLPLDVNTAEAVWPEEVFMVFFPEEIRLEFGKYEGLSIFVFLLPDEQEDLYAELVPILESELARIFAGKALLTFVSSYSLEPYAYLCAEQKSATYLSPGVEMGDGEIMVQRYVGTKMLIAG